MEEPLKIIRDAFDALKEPFFLLDGSFRCVLGNSAFLQLMGLQPEEGNPIPAVRFWPKVAQINWSADEVVTELISAKGNPIVVKLTAISCGDNTRCCRIVSATSSDDSVINFHSQRLESLGVLAGGIAHDFNNILTGILGHITYLKTILGTPGSHNESLNAIEDGARRASTMIQQILDFSRLEMSGQASTIDLSGVVSRTCTLLRGAISPRFEMKWDVPDRELLMLAEESKVAQIVINLVINSRDAIQPGGYIHITLEPENDQSRVQAAFGDAELLTESYARLTVTDNGHGIPKPLLKKIFEPYFSTKAGKGTGLGLATVSSIVHLLGGAIEVQSGESKGTAIAIYMPLLLPAIDKAHKSEVPETQAVPLVGGSERILVIDDEYPVRNVLSVSLEHLGYSVNAVASGLEALELFKDDCAQFDLVILDMLMPHMSGKEVFCELRKLCPDIKVLAISGFTSEESIRYILENGGMGFVQKPFTIEDLSRRVRECFE